MNRTRNKRNIRAETEPKQGWVYFIRNGKAIKIGFTTDLDQRLKRLQTASSVPLEVMGSIPGTLEDEQNLHRRFYNLNVRGEWFRGHPSLFAYIREATKPPEPEVEVEAQEPAEPRKPLPPEFRVVIRGLLKRRNNVGANTPEGCICTNIIGLIRAKHRNEPRPTWATHPTQTIEWRLKRSLEALEKYARSA